MTPPQPIDWTALARAFQRHQVDLVHREDGWSGDEFYAEALRRTFGWSANDGSDGRRELPYETVRPTTGLTTLGEADHTRESHTIVDRMNREAAERRAAEAQAESRAVIREAAQRLADYIRGRCNERSVPAKFRREGVALAADWIDPRVPKDRFGEPLQRTDRVA